MAKLTQTQIDDLKIKGFITQVVPSTDLADNTVDELKIKEFITVTDPSDAIEGGSTIAVTSVSLNKETLSLTVEGEETLTATVLPADASHPEVSWSSSAEAIATVDENGKVVGVSAGEATITATADSKSATCTVTVA